MRDEMTGDGTAGQGTPAAERKDAGGTAAERRERVMAMPPMARAAAIMRLLRSEEGCPWDREQTFDSIQRHTLEEVYEVFDAIERRSWGELRDELGDLLLQVLFYAQMAEEAGHFSLDGVAEALSAKLIRRHPHVFAEVQAEDSEAVLRNWERIKREEKASAGAEPKGLLADVPRSMPAVMEAAKLGSRAAKVGFDWPDANGLVMKVKEELAEVETELRTEEDATATAEGRAALTAEIGDLLFTVVNLARHVGVDAEQSLRGANAKFRRRFGAMERAMAAEGRDAAQDAPDAEGWDRLWRDAKEAEAR